MAIALMSLGENVFYVPMVEVETPGYETLQRDTSFTWIPQGRLNAPLALQYTGAGQDTIVIEGRLWPEFFGGIQTLAALRAAGAQGKPLPLIRYQPVHDENTGALLQGIQADVIGDFVIMRVRSQDKHIGSSGSPRMVEFALELQAYGNDSALASATGSSTVTQGTTLSQAQASQPSASTAPDPRVIPQ